MYVYARPLRDRTIALILELLPGFFGFLGFGWIYAGNFGVGLVILSSYLVGATLLVLLDILSGGFCCFVTVPIQVGAVALSAVQLNAYIKTRGDLFGLEG